MNPILLTIAIPTYNRAVYLDRCLESLLKQYSATEHHIEIIISDNCSPDDTEGVYTKYAQLLPVQYIKNKTNVGADLNISQGFLMAKGEYVLVFGDDDVFLANFLNDVINVLKTGIYGTVFLNYYGFLNNHLTEKPSFNPFNKAYQYDAEGILKVIRSRIGFISACIINKKFINEQVLAKGQGTYLIQVPLLLSAIVNSEKTLYIGEYLIAQQDANSSGFNFFKIFGVNFYLILKDALPNNKKAISWVTTHFIVLFFIGGVIDFRKKNKSNGDEPLSFLRPYYDQYLLFWLCIYPVAKLPYALAFIYSIPLRVIAKLANIYFKIPTGKAVNIR